MRVLLADDERLLADTVAEGLRKRAMAVDVCYDGTAAIERLVTEKLAVKDIVQLTGLDQAAVRRLRQLDTDASGGAGGDGDDGKDAGDAAEAADVRVA